MIRIVLIGILAILIAYVSFQFLPKSKIISTQIKSGNLIPIINKPKEVKEEPLNLEKIFLGNHELQPGLDREKLITVIATGDVIPARSTNFQTAQRNNFTWPFEKTADILSSADITFINLETPLMKNCQLINEGMRFCGSSKHIEGLKLAGVDVANFGNNHSANYGKGGIEETKKLLEDNGILVTGLRGAVYKQVKGMKFAFLGYTDIEKSPLVSVASEEQIQEEVKQARKNSDVVIVQYHWGTEYITEPEERQRFLGKLTVDSGADLVIGNHPHWIKPIEFYKGKLITYGHGNFVFDQEWSQKTKEGVVGRYAFIGKDLVDVEYLPVEIINYGQPYFLEGDKKQEILNDMYQESLKLKLNP